MTLNKKLIGLPHIYYINLDHEVERREFMETQFKTWGIENYTRVNASKFSRDDFNSWKHMIHLEDIFPKKRCRSLAVSLSHIETIKEWVENTKEEYLILMEDDTDISLIEYWHFDWEYLMNNIPYDWDAIQLGYNSNVRIYCFLHPKKTITWNGPMLLNRSYCEKLISLYYRKGKYNFIKKVNRVDKSNSLDSKFGDVTGRFSVVDVDEFMGFNGKVYQLPLFSQNPLYDDPPRYHHITSRKAHLMWWTVMRDEFTLEDFFTYGKSYDNKMILDVSWNKKMEVYRGGKV